MDLHSNHPYWLMRHGIKYVYPSLRNDLRDEIVIIGGGITGALIAYHLCKAGFSVTIIEKRHAGFGSTGASTALLQYEIDTPLHELINKVGESNAVRSYELCIESIRMLKKITGSLRVDTGFSEIPSLQFASFPSHRKALEKEFSAREKFGIGHLKWLESTELHRLFGITAPCGILSREGATVDAYALTHALLQRSIKMGAKMYDSTNIVEIQHGKKQIALTTSGGNTITTKHLVIACGYESQKYLTRQVEIPNSTYAIVSEPFENGNFWYKNAMIWETADPYLYLRKTDDNRILIGGKDDEFYNPAKRDAKLPKKAVALHQAFGKLFPGIDFRTDFCWAGYFCKTKDGLPYIGSVKQRPNTYFALGFGGNGITFSVIAASMLTQLLSGKKNKDLSIFSFER
ncbi:MAG: FAD-binding oxidoreductase [Chitinophagaceae bacterium]|nr:FAD-binding oxidoreductase [Chitinophagaceae bacterium]